jgi:hypothetical protein
MVPVERNALCLIEICMVLREFLQIPYAIVVQISARSLKYPDNQGQTRCKN